ncbi:MAG: 50S ribosomal protein L18 [Leptospirillia bacterium]
MAEKNKIRARSRRQVRIRKRLSGTPERPRLAVFRSNRFIYAQLIDDVAGRTLASASSRDDEAKGTGSGKNKDMAQRVGELLAARAKKKKVTAAVFDRGGYKYHGRVAALAEGARNGGLTF